MEDFRGTPIVVGSTIVYSVKASSSCYVREGVVTAIGETKHSWGGTPTPQLTVQPTGRGSAKWREAGTKPVRITNLANVVVVALERGNA